LRGSRSAPLRALVLIHALAWQLTPPRIRRPLAAIVVLNGFFVFSWLSSLGQVWLREQIGATALVSAVIALALSTAIALYAMWLLPDRATQPVELLPGPRSSRSVGCWSKVAVVFYFAPRLERSEETYGAFGAAATLLIWLYVISRLVTIAAFLKATLGSRRAGRVDLSAE
jgi:uncharacterized BrkB/YihY/UPF0761 family membrane protein